jgi:hypothetical protein
VHIQVSHRAGEDRDGRPGALLGNLHTTCLGFSAGLRAEGMTRMHVLFQSGNMGTSGSAFRLA